MISLINTAECKLSLVMRSHLELNLYIKYRIIFFIVHTQSVPQNIDHWTKPSVIPNSRTLFQLERTAANTSLALIHLYGNYVKFSKSSFTNTPFNTFATRIFLLYECKCMRSISWQCFQRSLQKSMNYWDLIENMICVKSFWQSFCLN